ncbi:calcium-translocating P-type ATPase, SERCA-type [Candidatus Bathyarchaeota archaeon]|nr:calcium-translocating P-type ATPase, SERCA-type [Candidatus Bathyarchaeota archaeon]
MSKVDVQAEKFYRKSVDETLEILETTKEGLSSSEAARRLEIHGLNQLEGKPPVPKWKKFLEQFNDFLIWILIASAIFSAIAAVVEDEPPTDTIVIAVILIINAILGYYQEEKADKAIEALKKMSAQKATVVRDGDVQEIPAAELVPGDIILLETGDQTPADARVYESMELKADEASLTGESLAVKKEVEVIDEDVTVGDMKNLVFSSTIITYGRGKAIVTSTGMQTEIGKIATIISETEEEMTPLSKKIDSFGKKLGLMILGICAASFIVYIIRGEPILLSIMVAISLAVAAIPEGLPAIVTTSLALGVQRMAKKNAIVRKLPSVETLGCTTVICSDKTGTLTKNEMTIQKLFISNDFIEVTGTGYEPNGEFYSDGDKINTEIHEGLNLLAKIGVLCNNANLRKDDDSGLWVITGDPTEAAFLTLGGKLGITRENQQQQYRRVSEVFFSSERKKMSTVDMDLHDESFIVSMKGALEVVLKDCTKILINGEVRPITDEDVEKLTEAQLAMSSDALRVLATAYKVWKKDDDMDLEPENVESDLIMVGLAGMIDPPRPEVSGSIEKCKQAGVRTIMITGDHAATAKAIALELNMLPKELDDGKKHIIQGKEIDAMADDELRQCDVFARVAPEHKMRIVSVLQDEGNIVSMTGDGVNDAPALKKADAGVAMGITGTDVSKGAADIILTDDNFASIVSAVEEGRAIYDNMKRFINFLISCNLGEILVIFLAAILFLPTPLLAIHLLWVNLLTDGLPALAMGFEKPDDDIMIKPPRPSDEPIITKRNWYSYISSGIFISFSCVFTFYLGLQMNVEISYGGGYTGNYWEIDSFLHGLGIPDGEIIDIMEDEVLPHARTLAFSSLVVSEMMNAFNCRSETISVFRKKLSDNWFLMGAILVTFMLNLVVIYVPFMSNVFKITGLDLKDWGWIFLIASPRIFSEEVIKIYWKKTHEVEYVQIERED